MGSGLQVGDTRNLSQEDPLKEEMATHSNILARKSHGQRSLVGYSPRVHKESDTTERLHFQRDISLGVLLFNIEIKH